MLKLIADSGSTKTDWTLLFTANPLAPSEVIAAFKTQGITPIHQTPADIRQILEHELLSQLCTFPRARLVDTKVLDNGEQIVQNTPALGYILVGSSRCGTRGQPRHRPPSSLPSSAGSDEY